MQDRPSAADILGIAIAHLQGNVLPDLSARAKFEMRVALSALQLAQRTLELTPTSDAAERARLEALLGETGDLRALNDLLCTHIRAGDVTLATPGIAQHLHATALEKLAVDQPNYAAYRHALGQ